VQHVENIQYVYLLTKYIKCNVWYIYDISRLRVKSAVFTLLHPVSISRLCCGVWEIAAKAVSFSKIFVEPNRCWWGCIPEDRNLRQRRCGSAECRVNVRFARGSLQWPRPVWYVVAYWTDDFCVNGSEPSVCIPWLSAWVYVLNKNWAKRLFNFVIVWAYRKHLKHFL
jgi:hypothetical protein